MRFGGGGAVIQIAGNPARAANGIGPEKQREEETEIGKREEGVREREREGERRDSETSFRSYLALWIWM